MKKLWKRNQIMITALALMIAIAGYLNFMGKQVDDKALFTTSAQFEENDQVALQDTEETDMAQIEDITQLKGDDLALVTGDTGEYAQKADSDVNIDGLALGNEATDDLALVTEDTDDYQALTDIDSMDSDEEMVYSDYLDENGEAVTTSSNVTEDYTGQTPGEAVFTSATAVSTLQSANLMKEQTREKNKQALLDIIHAENLSDEAKQDAVDQMIQLTDVTQRECSAQIMLEAKGFEDVIVSISGQQADVIVVANELTDEMRAQIEDIVSRKTGISPQNIIISPVSAK